MADRLVELGALLVDADQVARDVVEPGTAGLAAVVAEFGAEMLTADGSLDRSRLGEIIFADESRRRALNGIIHPLVHRRRQEIVSQAPSDAVVVEDVPLLVENDLTAAYPLVIVVYTPPQERVRRLVAYREMTEAEARARILAQASDDERGAAADIWLDNSDTPKQTLGAIDELWEQRLVPFEANLRARRPAARPSRAGVVAADPSWPNQARRLINRVRRAAGNQAFRVDHIGPTAVPGLAAADVIDVQVVVADLDTAAEVAQSLVEAGLVPLTGWRFDVGRDGITWDKHLAGNADPARVVNCHIRPWTSPAWQDALLMREWLRSTPSAVAEYAALAQHPDPRSTDVDEPTLRGWTNEALSRAQAWADQHSWTP